MSQQDELKWFKDHDRPPYSAFTNRRMRRAKTRRKLQFKQMTDNTKVRSSTTMSAEQIESKLLQLAKAVKKGAENVQGS